MGSAIALPRGGWRGQVQHVVGQTGQSIQAHPVVKVGQHRQRPGGTPLGTPTRIAQYGIDAIAADKTGENAAGYVPAADNQDFLHAGIVADD